MQKERLVIKNFGPIKSVDLELGKMTIIIGEQATGKSTIAKVLAVCRYFSYIVNFSVSQEGRSRFSTNDQFYQGLRYWDLDFYINKTSQIIYQNDLYRFEYENKHVIEHESLGDGTDLKEEFYDSVTKISHESTEFKRLLSELYTLRDQESVQTKTMGEILQFFSWTPNENFYRLNVKKIMDNPLYIPTERNLDNALSVRIEALQEEVNKINNIVKRYKSETIISPLSLIYKNQNGNGYARKQESTEFYPVYNGASGYQSTIPIVLAIKYYNEIENRQRTFIVEEPELNLFPKAQKALVEFFVESVNEHSNKFLLPTHSPYILSSVNNLLYAYVIGHLNDGEFKEQVKDIIPEKKWLNPEDISVYYLENGEAKDIFDRDENLINTDYIDSVSQIINDEFDKLLAIEVSHSNIHDND